MNRGNEVFGRRTLRIVFSDATETDLRSLQYFVDARVIVRPQWDRPRRRHILAGCLANVWMSQQRLISRHQHPRRSKHPPFLGWRIVDDGRATQTKVRGQTLYDGVEIQIAIGGVRGD